MVWSIHFVKWLGEAYEKEKNVCGNHSCAMTGIMLLTKEGTPLKYFEIQNILLKNHLRHKEPHRPIGHGRHGYGKKITLR